MTTIKESISRIRNVFKLVTEDAFLTDRFIYSLLLKHSKAFMRREDVLKSIMQYDSLFETLPVVDLIETDRIEAGCAGVKTGCKVMRTRDKLPELMTNDIGPVIRTVSSIDGQYIMQQSRSAVYVAIANSTSFKYNKTKYFWFKNGYLYFPNIDWDAVSIEGLFEGPVDGFCNENNDDCTVAQNRNFVIPDYLFTEIEQITQQELMTLGKIPADTGDNSQNIMR